jgi:hypothetical protein
MGSTSVLDNIEGQKASSKPGVFSRLSGGLQGHFIAVIAEFMGTFLFLFFAFAGMIELIAVRLRQTDTLQAPKQQTPHEVPLVTTTRIYLKDPTLWCSYR